ncbi:MAG: hypothetical protein PVF65_12015 [Sphingomonadales bacterium]
MNDHKQKIEPIVSWTLGLWFLFIGVIGLGFQTNTLDSVLHVVIAMLLLPPIRQTVYQYHPKRLPGLARAIIIILLVAFSPNWQATFTEAQSLEKSAEDAPEPIP